MSIRDDIAVTEAPALQTLTDNECRRRLAGEGVGRIAIRSDNAPLLRPVNFVLQGDDVVIRTGEGSIIAAARAGEVASFEVDDIDRLEHTGWSVILSGKLYELPTDDQHLALPLRPWASGRKDRFVGLAIDQISGLHIPAGRGNR